MAASAFKRLRNLPRYVRRKNVDWRDSYKFWMETLRTVSLGTLGAIFALIILRPTEQRINFSGEVESTRLRMRADAIKEFETASYFYTAAAKSAWKSRKKEDWHKFEGNAFMNFKLARTRLARSFDSAVLASDKKQPLDELVNNSEALAGEMHNVCKGHEPDAQNSTQSESLTQTAAQTQSEAVDATLSEEAGPNQNGKPIETQECPTWAKFHGTNPKACPSCLDLHDELVKVNNRLTEAAWDNLYLRKSLPTCSLF